eukprot:CAMPEP_0185840212 /NCGR_PEP_ID=MMETSP1353-20130828/15866_1 /TAXON_ID=1077150 /ORGANISM="Erythrolobus australicus, Strain CCMP3124" /LENGTH=41 /DNA_ID= /DNA_START= /DNA_END= /DNA_ORIENTATION=
MTHRRARSRTFQSQRKHSEAATQRAGNYRLHRIKSRRASPR